ncbi:MAG: GNAT family N-acetyltransferase [Flavobacteriaceae bacterium]|nr:GNAT family N-acetyltransferase [Flavobacteriaceae bacterium]
MESKENQYKSTLVFSVSCANNTIVSAFKISKEDAWSVCDFVTANEDRLLSFFPGTREQNLTPDLSKRFTTLKEKQFDASQEFLFTLREENSRKVIGLVYIKELDWKKKQGELAYAVDYNWEGKGVTSNVVTELSKHAFEDLGLETLQIIAHKSNIGSAKVAVKNGFQWIKTLPKEFTPKGKEPMDMELYELYRNQS